jgi:dolichol-phosphate mannosyltransferase
MPQAPEIAHCKQGNGHPALAAVVSIIIPVKDEAAGIQRLAEEVSAVMDRENLEWEAIWVDDGSTDASLRAIKRLNEQDPRHRYLSFKKNAGQSAGLWAGFQSARGDIIATIDGDGQNDPADIPRLAAIISAGEADMVNGYREKRSDNWIRKAASRIANSFRNRMTGKTVRDVGCSTRAFRSECADCLPQFKGMHRFLPTLVRMQGYRLQEVPVNHRKREHGRTKYTINNRLWVGLFDTFGVFWLKHRGFSYQIQARSDHHPETREGRNK